MAEQCNELQGNTFPGKRIGIMGGTFDPIHYGHLLIAENAAEQFSLDEVMFMPTGYSPHKGNSITDSKLRCDMVMLAIRDNPHFSLSLLEVNSNDINYTYKTLEHLKAQNPDKELFFIMGGDSLFDFDSWKHPERILNISIVLAAVRDNWEGDLFDRQIAYLNHKYNCKETQYHKPPYHKSSCNLWYGNIFRLHTPNFSISSKNIRKLVSNNKTIRYMLPDEVLFYIQKYKLYQNVNGSYLTKDF